MLHRTVLSCIVGLSLCVNARAETPKSEESIKLADIMMMSSEGPPSLSKSGRAPLPKFEKVTKDMVAAKGLFTLWSYPSDAKDKDSEKLLCQIPSSLLGENIMLSVSFSGGGFFTGFPLTQRVVRWEVLGRELLLVEPETQFVVDDAKTVSDVVRRTYPERIRKAVPMVTKSPGGDPVINLGSMLKGNFADIAWMSLGGGRINPKLSKWTTKKSFELNVEIGVELAMARISPPGSFDKKQVHFSFWKLPDTGYQPRVADDRVGYFLTANQDWAKPSDARDIFNRYVDRWQLEKRDPSLPLCEPKKPIIYYIEKTVPVRFRRAVRDGILEWNKAFEKVGFVNAIEVRQQTNDNEWKDLDPEDMRYSFFRWIVTGFSFAMGPHRSNPFTGQIYDADIVFDDSMIRVWEARARNMISSEALTEFMRDPALSQFFEQYPRWKRMPRSWERFVFGNGEEQELMASLRQRMRKQGHIGCDFAEGMKHQLAVAQSVLAGKPKEVTERFLYDSVKETVMHEVGHTLGLRHNFKGSSVYTLEEIKRRSAAGEATVGSVMDYNPILLFGKDGADAGHFQSATIGPYDYWAIEYGYRPADGTFGQDKDDESAEPEGKKGEQIAKAETKSSELGTIRIEGKEIPKELLDKLPPEARKLIMAKAGKNAGSGGKAAPKKPAAPAFTGPNAAELDMLNTIASRASEPELAYGSDEDATILGPDPRAVRWDMGSDPIAWAQNRIDLVNRRMDNILDWGVKDRESWYHLRRTFATLLFEKARVLDFAARFVGGQNINRSHRGDANAEAPFELVSVETQRKAMDFVEKNLYDDNFFSFSPDVLNHLAASRWWHAGTQISFTVDFPIHDYIAMLQWRSLLQRLFPNELRRIYDAELKSRADDKFTASEYLRRIQDGCWSDVNPKRASAGSWTDAQPLLSSIRRSLQREYLNIAELLVRYPPGVLFPADLHAMVQHSLRKLAERIDKTLATGKADFASEAHLTSCKSRIDRMLTSELREFPL